MHYDTISEAFFDFHKKILKSELDFMIKYDITPSQMLFIKFLYFEQFNELFRYLGMDVKKFKISKDKFTVDEINDLHKKGFLTNRWNKNESLYPDQNDLVKSKLPEISIAFNINPEHIEKQREKQIEMNRFIEQVGEELFDVYNRNPSGLMLTACNSFTYKGVTYEGRDDVQKLYAEQISYDLSKHREVINKIRSAPDQCTVKITNFVRDKMWENIRVIDWNENV